MSNATRSIPCPSRCAVYDVYPAFSIYSGTRLWKEVQCHGPSPGVRENNGVVEYKGSLYLFGGYNGSQWLNDFHGFHIGERSEERGEKGDEGTREQEWMVTSARNDPYDVFMCAFHKTGVHDFVQQSCLSASFYRDKCTVV